MKGTKFMKKIGVVGCGAIGSEICKVINRQGIPCKLVSIYDTDLNKSKLLIDKLRNRTIKIAKSLKELVNSCDIVFEAATPATVYELSKICFPAKKDLFVMSAGGLIIYPSILKSAKKYKCNVYYPSGAICGLDGVRAAAAGKIRSVTLTTTKPLLSLKDSPGLKKYLSNNNININDIRKIATIFSGTTEKATVLFPQNINVSAALSLAGIGPRKTNVNIVVDPNGTKNIHQIEVISDSGRIFTRTENVPSPDNPKTSYLAILSAISTLKLIV